MDEQQQMDGDQHRQSTILKANTKAFIPLEAQTSALKAKAKPFTPGVTHITNKISAMDINSNPYS